MLQFCSNYEVSNKALYPTFARTKPHDSRISMSVVSLLQKYNWRKVVFVYNKEMPDIADTISKVSHKPFKDSDIELTAWSLSEAEAPLFWHILHLDSTPVA